MEPVLYHPWDLDKGNALTIQLGLAPLVISNDELYAIKYVGGVDVAYDKQGDRLFAAVAILNADSHEIIEVEVAEDTAQFPYIPGLFSFRELPPIAKVLSGLGKTPDLIVCDGHGLAHPRRFGLACHLGVLFDIPTIGCGKTRLIGKSTEVGTKRGDFAPLVDNNEIVGSVLRTQTNVRPVYVSVGHRISLQTARQWILSLSPNYRLPETLRMADQAARKALAK